MSGRLGPLLAQVLAETRTRLRSTSTLLAALALLAASFLWIQDPGSQSVSLSWRLQDGARATGLYDAAFVGLISAVLAASFLPLVGFYLVAGSVRRDRDTGVGAVLAATPLTNAAYLLGKWLAHTAYLSVLQGLAVLSGMLLFWRHGIGPLSVSAFLIPSLLFVTPAVAFTAALAVLFDAAPRLRERTGLVVYFFAAMLLVFVIPGALAGLFGTTALRRPPFYDPAGTATLRYLVSASVPDSVPNSVSVGVIVSRSPLRRVRWPDAAYPSELVAVRALGLLVVAVPLWAATRVFDRFDPARSARRAAARPAAAAERTERDEAAARAAPFALSPAVARPSLLGSVLAEARLIWDLASWLKWPLLASALAALFTPAGSAAFLILLAPVISEVAARESLAGTRALVFSQPGVPQATVLWKAAAAAAFVLAFGAPGTLRALSTSAGHGIAYVTGLLFVAAVAVSAGSLTGGGKLFTAAYTPLWYVALNGKAAGPLDYCGAFGGGLEPATRWVYLGTGTAALGLALLVERRRQRA